MHPTWRTILVGSVFSILTTVFGATPAQAQTAMTGEGRSLGGYGGALMDAGMSGPAIPYSGRFAGFMPFRMGGSGSLSFQTRGTTSMGSARTSFSLSPMSSMSSPMGSRGSLGTRLGGGMPTMSGTRGLGVMPPSFGYPFRQPPSLIAPSSPGMGMSM